MRIAEISSSARYMPEESIMSRPIAGEVVLLNLQSGVYYSLNGAGALIWTHIERGEPVDETVRALLDEYDVAPDVAARDVETFVQTLVEKGLLRAR